MQVASLGLASELMVRRAAGSQVEDRDAWLVVRTPYNPSFWWGNFLVLPQPVQPGQGRVWRQRFLEAFPAANHLALAVDDDAGHAGDTDELAALNVKVDVSTVLSAPAQAVAGPVAVTEAAAPSPWCGPFVRTTIGSDFLLCVEPVITEPRQDNQPRQPRSITLTWLAESRRLAPWCSEIAARGSAPSTPMTWWPRWGVVSDGSGLVRYQDVETHPAHRRQGLARALIRCSANHATSDMGAATLVIVADPTYHAVDLYRSAGFSDAGHLVQLQVHGY